MVNIRRLGGVGIFDALLDINGVGLPAEPSAHCHRCWRQAGSACPLPGLILSRGTGDGGIVLLGA
jgi:hypothetical protein